MTIADAEDYVEKARGAWGLTNGAGIPASALERIAKAELAYARNAENGVSDEDISSAFNKLTSRIPISERAFTDAYKISIFRQVHAALYPRLFAHQNGLRPTAAIVLLYLLIYNAGVPEGALHVAATHDLKRLRASTTPVLKASVGDQRRSEYLWALRSLPRTEVEDLVGQVLISLGM